MPPRLLAAYRRTAYEAGGVVVRIGSRSLEADRLLARLRGRSGGFVSAWNPFSRRAMKGANRRMQRALASHARRLPSLPGHGAAGRWSEEHLLVIADPRLIERLARRFRQSAIVVIRPGHPARLRLLR